MVDTSIALNRFGLGARPDEAPPANPRKWLLGQLDSFDPKPAALATQPTREKVAGELADYLEQVRALRQQEGVRPGQARSAQAGATGVRPGAQMAAPAQMGDQAMMAQGGAMTGATPGKPGDKANPAMAAPPEDPNDPVVQARRFAQRQARDYYVAAVGARADAALVSPAPFVERLVHFWANHFAISIDKVPVVGLGGLLEFEAIRPNVLGTFGDMLNAVERHPAMLLYLDQAQSVGPNSPVGARAGQRGNQRLGLNENLAREIMELHTLGVRTVYDQADVTEFARAMTGWTVAGLSRGLRARFAGTEGVPGDFIFATPLHEPGVRTIMGKSYDQEGERQAQAVLSDLATHPATATHIATKLARHFAGDTPPPALVQRMQTAFLKTGGDLPSVYRVLIDSPESWVAQAPKFKTPWEWSISVYRALGTKNVQAGTVSGLLSQLGQPTWKPGSPAGYDDIAASWAGPDAILRRVESAERFATRAGALIDARALAPKLFPAVSPATTQALARAESPGQALALLLVAPEMMRR
ncbi:MAG: hypothetical protein JWN66_89 [Sphingomonas bacterium]|uniref:DUF1800 domain-containing protein n=1 Tax=Sphingomonas bacterium TaxID=1895847 RepID=UPI002620B9F1|nr:DUF1800 domain-containing protein [Sphingomonas bacterium]MDB5702973.1 hypothetical protein [Sphingomonas bacterium]